MEDGGFTVKIGDTTLTPGETSTFEGGTSLKVTISGSGEDFRGVLARLGGDIDTTGVFTLMDNESMLQISDPCANDGVSSLCCGDGSDDDFLASLSVL